MVKRFAVVLALVLALVLVLAAALAGGSYLWWHRRAPLRPEYVLVNETGRHDFDLAFRMSLKLAEKKSGIENALVLLAALAPDKTIEETAAEQFSKLTNLRGMGSRQQAIPIGRPTWINDEFLSGGAGALVRSYSKSLGDYERAIRHLPDVQLGAFNASAQPATTLQRYLASLELGIGDPRLPLLTEGSRIFRAVVPRDEAQQKRIFEFLQAAAPHPLLASATVTMITPGRRRVLS
jgi:hypothetical protein